MSRAKIETFSTDLSDFSMKYAYFRGFRRASLKSLKGRMRPAGRRLPMAGINFPRQKVQEKFAIF
jgi:hypothetical protein